MEPRSEELTKYCCRMQTANKPVGNPTAGLHKLEDNEKEISNNFEPCFLFKRSRSFVFPRWCAKRARG